MSLVTLAEAKNFCDIESPEFDIHGNNNLLKMKYDGGSSTSVTLTNDTYGGDGLATHLASVIDTALSCTSTVTWSDTTNKFTIAVTAGHTIQYIHSGSTAGYDIGFTTDSSASQSITSDSACGDPTEMLNTLLGYVDTFVKTYCHRDFESTSYTETYDGKGKNYIDLKNYPVTALTFVRIGTDDVISVNNTATTTYAVVSSDKTTMTLNKDGTASTLTLGDYTVLSELVTAINALSGWVAVIQSTEYNNILVSELTEFYGLSCLDSQMAYLTVWNQPESDMRINTDTGRIWLDKNVYGIQNIYVAYTGGYSTIPSDLKMATLILIKYLWDKRQESTWGVRTFSLGEVRKSLFTDIPTEAKAIMDAYKRYLV